MSHSPESSQDEFKGQERNENKESHKDLLKRCNSDRHWTSMKNVIQSARDDDGLRFASFIDSYMLFCLVGEVKASKTLLPIPRLPSKKKTALFIRENQKNSEIINSIDELEKEDHDERGDHQENIKTVRSGGHHSTVNLDIKKKEIEQKDKEEDPKFKEYIRKLQQDHRKDRLNSFGDKIQDQLKRSVKIILIRCVNSCIT